MISTMISTHLLWYHSVSMKNKYHMILVYDIITIIIAYLAYHRIHMPGIYKVYTWHIPGHGSNLPTIYQVCVEACKAVMVYAVTGIHSTWQSNCIMLLPDWCLINHLSKVIRAATEETLWNKQNWIFWLLSAQSCAIHNWVLQAQYGHHWLINCKFMQK